MFYSILFPGQQEPVLQQEEPACFRDLNLDRIVRPIAERETEIGLSPIFYTPLTDEGAVRFRQQILRDLTCPETAAAFGNFSRELCALAHRYRQAQSDVQSGDPWKNHWLTKGRLLDCGERFCAALDRLRQLLPSLELHSQGLEDFAAYLNGLCSSDSYCRLSRTQKALRAQFDQECYCMLIRDGSIQVKNFEGEADLSADILKTFDKFRQEGAHDYRQKFSEEPYADHVEAGLLACLSRLYPQQFRALDSYLREFPDWLDPVILKFCREVRFYLDWLDSIRGLQSDGLPFCFPQVQAQGSHFSACGFYDLVLALQIGPRTVTNDFTLDSPERLFTVTGPNQGGKTTFARAFGQLHYLAALGLCVPGSSAVLRLPDRVLTHFEREERLTAQSGKLQDDLERLRGLLEQATDRSIVIINEIFASTTLQDALLLGGHMMDALADRGCTGVVVTFLDKLAEHGPETVSLMSAVSPTDPAARTFRIGRRPPDGLAYAMVLARRHGLTYEQIIRRIPT